MIPGSDVLFLREVLRDAGPAARLPGWQSKGLLMLQSHGLARLVFMRGPGA
jgi:hypothetical protein